MLMTSIKNIFFVTSGFFGFVGGMFITSFLLSLLPDYGPLLFPLAVVVGAWMSGYTLIEISKNNDYRLIHYLVVVLAAFYIGLFIMPIYTPSFPKYIDWVCFLAVLYFPYRGAWFKLRRAAFNNQRQSDA